MMPGTCAALPDRHWTTESFDDHCKMTRWTDIVSRHMTEMDVGSERPEDFQASWRQFALGPLDLNFINAMPQHIHRTPVMVSRSASSTYELVFMKKGAMTVRYRSGDEFIPESDFALLRNAEPYEFICREASEALTAHVSDDWVRQWLPSLESFSELPSAVRTAWGRPLAALFGIIDEVGLDNVVLPREVIADQIGALLGLMSATQGRMLGQHSTSMLKRVRAILADRYGEPDLTPEGVALDAGISRRHLHGLFAKAGSTFGRELIELRLRSGARQLEDRRYNFLSVGEIAYRVGFNDSSHFARRFRMRFGISPSMFRSKSS